MEESLTNSISTLNPAVIFQPDVFENIKYQSYYFIESIDRDGAAEYSRILEKVLNANEARDKSEQEIFQILNFWMLRLKLFGFESLGAQEKQDLFKKYLVDILKNDLDLKGAIFRYIDIFEGGDAVTEQTTLFVNNLVSSPIKFGSKADAFRANNFQSTLSNWLKEYQYSINKRGANLKPAAFDMINFINNDVNVKYLNPQEIEILKKILELYNWLLSPLVYMDEKQMGRTAPYMVKEKLKLPNEIINAGQEEVILAPTLPQETLVSRKAPPAIPAPKNLPSLRPMADVAGKAGVRNNEFGIQGSQEREQADVKDDLAQIELKKPETAIYKTESINQQAASAGTPEATKPGTNSNKFSNFVDKKLQKSVSSQLYWPVNIQDILKQKETGDSAGLKIGGVGNQEVGVRNQGLATARPPEASKSDEKSGPDIDKKLEELKKKVGE